MAENFDLVINKFYGGIVRDEKSKIIGGALNVEECDIWTSASYFQAEQIFSTDAAVSGAQLYARAVGDNDTHWAYGGKTTATVNTVRIVSHTSGGADNPGTLGGSVNFTSADTTNLASQVSDLAFFRSTEASNATSVYYIQGATTNWYLNRYNIGAAAEQTWGGSSWGAGTANASSRLTGLDGSFMRPTMKVIFGDLYICQGRYIAKVSGDTAATFTEKAFTLPSEWEAVDIEAVGDAAIILCRNKATASNKTSGFWWDLTKSTQFEDYFTVPFGGPCWIKNVREMVTLFCAANGIGKFFRLSSAAKGANPLLLPGIRLTNLRADASTEPISSPKKVDSKDDILYFGLNKTDKTGLYALGQLDSDKPIAVILSKRFATTDYANHKPVSLKIQGPNFYADYDDSGTVSSVRCESNNSPTRSS